MFWIERNGSFQGFTKIKNTFRKSEKFHSKGALRKKGEEENRDDENEDGSRNIVQFERVQEMLCLEYIPGDPFPPDEVWYDILECKEPKDLEIPPESELNAVYLEAERLG